MKQDGLDSLTEGLIDAPQSQDLISATNLPPYHIIASCKTIGFAKPLDCFWSEMPGESRQIECECSDHRRIGSRWSGLRLSAPIQVNIHRCLFNDKDGSTCYLLGQCPACRTIYWSREASA